MSDVKIEIVRMKLADLKPASYNPRRISEEALGGLGRSIDKFGVLSHIVWNKRSGNVVGGHQRLRCLLDAGETESDVVVVDLNDNEEVALNITLNNRHIRGDFTRDIMEQLRVSEARLGSEFKALGLLDLYEQLRDSGIEREKKKDKKDRKEDGAATPGAGDDAGKPTDTVDDQKPQTLIVCPQCRSQWQMRDNKVVFNAVTGTGNPVVEKGDKP